jgi:hypothetical protein
MNNRRTWLTLALVAASLISLAAGAGWLYFRYIGDPTANGLAYMGLIRVDAAYRDISAYHGGSDSCNCVQRWYIGPAELDPTLSFKGQGLVWVPARGSNPPAETGWYAVAYADPTTPQTGRCHLSLVRETSAYYLLDDVVRMSNDQVNGSAEGKLDVIELDLECDRDADGL